MPIGQFGLPGGHVFAECFRTRSGQLQPPALLRVASVTSLDPREADPRLAYASKVTFDLHDMPDFRPGCGQHATVVNTAEAAGFQPKLAICLAEPGTAADRLASLDEADAAALKTAPIRNYSFAGEDMLIVRRQGLCSNFLVSRRPGDVVMVAAPISNAFLAPPLDAPALFFGLGTSVSPYRDMLRERCTGTATLATSRLYINHRHPDLEYFGTELRHMADQPDNRFAYRPLFSGAPECSGGVGRVTELIAQPDEARVVFDIVMRPNSHVYVSGVMGFAQQIESALRSAAAAISPIMAAQIGRALDKARQDGRFHAEGSAASGVQSGLQGE